VANIAINAAIVSIISLVLNEDVHHRAGPSTPINMAVVLPSWPLQSAAAATSRFYQLRAAVVQVLGRLRHAEITNISGSSINNAHLTWTPTGPPPLYTARQHNSLEL
jgi:hypothetical protein